MVGFIDDHRGEHGVEPICDVLPIAPSTYYDHLAKRADPANSAVDTPFFGIFRPSAAVAPSGAPSFAWP